MDQERLLWWTDECVSKGLKNGRMISSGEGRLGWWGGEVEMWKEVLAVEGRVAWEIWETPCYSIRLKCSMQKEERANMAREEAELVPYCNGSCKEFGPDLRLTGSQWRVPSRGARWIRFTFYKDYLALVMWRQIDVGPVWGQEGAERDAGGLT